MTPFLLRMTNTVRPTTFSIAQWMNFTSQMLSEREYDHQIHLKILPEPYTGDPEANIILLNLNPGFYERSVSCVYPRVCRYHLMF